MPPDPRTPAPRLLIAITLLLAALSHAPANDSVHLSYHWHLHQPIYWPERAPAPQNNRYQFAADSVGLKFSNNGNYYAGSSKEHPENQLINGDGGQFQEIFSKADKINAYQFAGRNSIATLGGHADGGASVSYSGSLMENIWSFGKDNAHGYGSNWNAGYSEARGWTTSGGFPKADMIGITFHHAFSPLLPKSVLRKEIQIFKELWWKTWGGNPDKSDHSKGFWPVECAFSQSFIDVLVEEGYEWVIIPNSHLARTCQNYMDVASKGNSGWNIDPPNRADRLGPWVPANQWWSGQQDGRGGTFPAPFAYQAHRAKHVNPATGAESIINVVPMCDLLSYQNGFASMGTGDIDSHIAPYNNPAQPCLVLMAHDGDNAWGGGASYYQESVPNLMNEAASKGYSPTTIQQFLNDHPVPAGDIVHVEDGAWVNAANDWGHPQFINWLWPPVRPPSDPAYDSNDPRTWYDPVNGWASDYRNWAVIIAATNHVETAENLLGVAAWKIQEPYQKDGTDNNPNAAEQGWHFLLGALDSGFMYYGVSLDDEVKQTLACNIAVDKVAATVTPVIETSSDTVPPTVFKPQRWPHNPGGMGWGPLTGYRAVGFEGNDPYDSDFHIWTLVHDVSGIQSVTLKVRLDNDGVNSLATNDNETYAGGAEVGPWQDLPMTGRAIPTGNVYNDNEINYFLAPTAIADHYYAAVDGYRNQLLDYYVEAVDSQGNTHRSEIQHVYVEDDGTPGSNPGGGGNPGDPGPQPIVMNGAADSDGYLLTSPGMTIYAAVRDDILYLATWSPGNAGGANDHFLFVTDNLESAATTDAPWAKSGSIAAPADAPFLAAESTSGYIDWFNTGSATTQQAKSGNNSGQMEGTLNLTEAFGSIPSSLYIAAVAYETDDAGTIAAQAPSAAGTPDSNLDPAEFLEIPVAALNDENQDGTLDRLDASKEFKVNLSNGTAGTNTLRWNTVPGKTYRIQYSLDLATWNDLPGAVYTAASGVLSLEHLDLTMSGQPHVFYRATTDN
ncbi:MAG: hypothetical protein AAF591_21500 [Verrucomicrobiota bacterium]